MSVEYDLLKKYVLTRVKYEQLSEETKQTKEALDKCEDDLANFMTDSGMKTTSKYLDLGHVTLLDPRVAFTNYDKFEEPNVFKFIEEKGEGPMIKLQVHPSSFRSFVGRMLKQGVSIPPFIQYGLRPSIRYTEVKE